MINIAVCDDDLEITKSINKLLMKYQDERDLDFTVDLFNDGSGLKSSILKGKKYDLIYLDIEMRQMNGIATAKYIRSIDTTVLLIYVSNYDNYLKELFEVEPFRFMSKPINDKRFYMFLDLVNNPVPVSLLSGDRKPQIRFLGNHHSGSGNLYHKSFRM